MQKIAVLGGGIGALATAAELTNDPDWQKNYDITIYQMGWRLGGKGASGRNRDISDRIQEHGIHLWMGFYEKRLSDDSPGLRRSPPEKSHAAIALHRCAQSVFADELHTHDGTGRHRLEAMEPRLALDRRVPRRRDHLSAASTTPNAARLRKNPSRPRHRLSRRKKDKHPVLVTLYQEAAGHLCSAVASVPVPRHLRQTRPHLRRIRQHHSHRRRHSQNHRPKI